jgi:predicted GNAT family acetyltransferase
MYAGFFVDDIMVARAAVEKYSERAWEVADVRTVKEYRNRGYAHQLCKFVLKYICANNIIPTIRTEEDNYIMQQIISKLGFTELNV